MTPTAGTRQRFVARGIDLVVVFFAYIATYWVAALLYYAVSGCADAGLTTVCGNEDAGGYVVIVVFVLGFVFPLIYESALRRTLGKTLTGLEIVDRDGQPASRGLRLKRSLATWVPLLALAAATLSAPADVSGVAGMVLFVYVIGVCGLIVWDQPTPWDRLLGTRVVHRRDTRAEEPVQTPAENDAPARRRYRRTGRRR